MTGAVSVETHSMPIPAPASEAMAIISMIERAARDPGVDIDKMERLLKMHGEAVARQARQAYSAALAAMQQELPVIQERGAIKIGTGPAQKYALWEDINEAIKPILAKHGFALSFRTGRNGDRIMVTGILSHRDGHAEETTMELPADQSGSKNAVQAIGSSTSYGKRYTASALLNLTSRGEDDDGRSTARITEEQVMELRDLAEAVEADMGRFLRYLGIEKLSDLPATKHAAAVEALNAKRRS